MSSTAVLTATTVVHLLSKSRYQNRRATAHDRWPYNVTCYRSCMVKEAKRQDESMFLVEMYECGQVQQVKYFADKQQAWLMCGAEAEQIAEENNGKWS